ncbi:PEBP-like protein [Podospora fimiseda]|uniref:PEBP-like protein n=1 Tax=Podospora fimiseda TaxID=252190 RepID=A0AAN6YMW4_9PEZI|nr:PEBP-like protein [Podospora fimiseda]
MRLITTTLLFFLSPLISAQTPPGFTPSTDSPLLLTFGTKSLTTPGTNLTKSESSVRPTIGTASTLPQNNTYIYLMIDVDVPFNFQNPAAGGPRRTNLHALITGYKPSATANSQGIYELTSTSTGPIAYIGPGPPPETPLYAHKYVNLLFETEEGLDITRAQVGQTFGFDINVFLANVKGIGPLVAGNWIEVAGQWN